MSWPHPRRTGPRGDREGWSGAGHSTAEIMKSTPWNRMRSSSRFVSLLALCFLSAAAPRRSHTTIWINDRRHYPPWLIGFVPRRIFAAPSHLHSIVGPTHPASQSICRLSRDARTTSSVIPRRGVFRPTCRASSPTSGGPGAPLGWAGPCRGPCVPRRGSVCDPPLGCWVPNSRVIHDGDREGRGRPRRRSYRQIPPGSSPVVEDAALGAVPCTTQCYGHYVEEDGATCHSWHAACTFPTLLRRNRSLAVAGQFQSSYMTQHPSLKSRRRHGQHLVAWARDPDPKLTPFR